jgi:divalent metal cation (Fe/Co/Zn/Cd) transporter
VDAFGAILISVVIIGRWGSIIYEQMKKIVGHTAPPEFVMKVTISYDKINSKNVEFK